MTLEFACITNLNIPMVNSAKFAVDGREVTIDRTYTDYVYDPDTGRMAMRWKECYIWNGEFEDFDITPDFADRAVFKEFEIEDDYDTPEDYEIVCLKCTADF